MTRRLNNGIKPFIDALILPIVKILKNDWVNRMDKKKVIYYSMKNVYQ